MAPLPLAPASHEDVPVDISAGPSGFSGPDKLRNIRSIRTASTAACA